MKKKIIFVSIAIVIFAGVAFVLFKMRGSVTKNDSQPAFSQAEINEAMNKKSDSNSPLIFSQTEIETALSAKVSQEK